MRWGLVFARLSLGLMSALVAVPLIWTLLNAFKRNVDLLVPTPRLFFTPTFENLTYILVRDSVLKALINSIVICSVSVVLGLVLGLPAAYAVARYRNRWTDEVQFFVLSLRFLPPVAVAIPMIVIWLNLGLYDTRASMIFTYVLLTLSITIWLSIPAFERIPREVEEAARVDGYGPYAIFWRVALPVASRLLIGAVAFSFVLVWNEFLFALMLTTGDARTLPIIASEMSQLGMNVPWGILNAAVVLLSLPPLLLLGLLAGFLNTIMSPQSR
jgi:multiple sugar transport system permease protein